MTQEINNNQERNRNSRQSRVQQNLKTIESATTQRKKEVTMIKVREERTLMKNDETKQCTKEKRRETKLIR